MYTTLFARCFVLVMWVPPCLCIAVDWSVGVLMHVLWVPQVLGLDASLDARFQAWNQFSELFTQLNIPIIVDDRQLKKVLAPRKKRRIRRKQVVRPVEEIVID